MRNEYSELITPSSGRKTSNFSWLRTAATLAIIGALLLCSFLAGSDHGHVEDSIGGFLEVPVGPRLPRRTCKILCDEEVPAMKVLPYRKTETCPTPGKDKCNAGYCCEAPPKPKVEAEPLPVVAPIRPREEFASFPSDDQCNEAGEFPPAYVFDPDTAPHVQFQTTEVTVLNVARPLIDIPTDAVMFKNSLTGPGPDGTSRTVTLTTGTDKTAPKVFSVNSGGEKLIQLTEDRSGTAGGNGEKIKEALSGSYATCSSTTEKTKTHMYQNPGTGYGFSMASEGMKSADSDYSAIARWTMQVAGSTLIDIWVANGYILPLYLTKAEKCEFLKPTDIDGPHGKLHIIRRDVGRSIIWELPLVSWQNAALTKNTDTTLRSGFEYELKQGAGRASAFRVEKLDRLFGPWAGTRDFKGRDPREFALSLDMALHGNEPLYAGRPGPGYTRGRWWLSLDTCNQGMAQIFEWVTQPFPKASRDADLLTAVGELKCILKYDHRDAGVTQTNALSPNSYLFLDWVLDSQSGTTGFNLHNKAQMTTGANFAAKTDMASLLSDFDSKIKRNGNDAYVGDADKGSGNLMKVSGEQFYAFCVANPGVTGCADVETITEKTSWETIFTERGE